MSRKPRDSNPFGALDDSMNSSVDSRRSSWASRRSSRGDRGESEAAEVDLLGIVEGASFRHQELNDFDETSRRKTFDGAGGASARGGGSSKENRRNTFAPSGKRVVAEPDLLVFSAEKKSASKRTWSNQSPSASVLSERTSDRKRAGRSPGRRMTADPYDLAALMCELEGQEEASVSLSIQDVTSAILLAPEDEAVNSSHTFSTLETQDGEGESFRDERRTTADPADLAAMLAALNDSDQSKDASSASFVSAATPRSRRQSTASVASAASSSKSAKSSKSSKSVASAKSAKSAQKKEPEQEQEEERQEAEEEEVGEDSCAEWDDLTSSPFNPTNTRRTTADATDMEAVMRELEAEAGVEAEKQPEGTNTSAVMTRSMRNALAQSSSLNTSTASAASRGSKSGRSKRAQDTRRMTADPSDMAALLDNLDDSMCYGRESIDTVVLVRSVANLLDDVDQPEGDLSTSTLSYSVASGSASRRSSHASMNPSPGPSPAGRRITADMADLAALAEELEASQQRHGDETGDGEGNEEEEYNTEPTAQLLDSVQRVLGEEGNDMNSSALHNSSAMSLSSPGVNMSVSLEVAEAEGAGEELGGGAVFEEEETSMCSLGGLLRRDMSRTESPMAIQAALAPLSPSTSALPATSAGAGLKSCLSSRKQRPPMQALSLPPASARKSVVFGSPKVAEFVRGAPSGALTPMNREEAKSLFSMVGSHVQATREEEDEDEATAENSRILEEWDRLTNTSGEGSDDDEIALPGTPSFDQGASPSPSKGPSSTGSRRRRSMLQPPLEVAQDMSHVSNTSQASLGADDATGTIALPGDLAELLRQNASESPAAAGRFAAPAAGPFSAPHGRQSMDASRASADDCTQDLEADLESMLRHVDYQQVSIVLDESANTSMLSEASARSAQSQASGRSSASGQSAASSSSGALGPLLGRVPASHAAGPTPLASPGTPISAVGSTESEVSFLRLDDQARKTVSFSLADSMQSAASVHADGHTVQLEGRLGDLLETSVQADASTSALSTSISSTGGAGLIRGKKRVNTPRPKAAEADMDEDNEDGEEEHTHGLESSLHHLVANLNQSDASPLSVIMSTEGEGGAEEEHYYGEHDDANDISTASTRSLGSQASRGDDEAQVSYSTNAARNSLEVSQMMARLRTLNAGARQNSLSHCGTPLAPASRLSLGIKRQSILDSASRAREGLGMARSALNANALETAEAAETKAAMASAPVPAPAPAAADIVTLFAAADLTTATSVSESPFSLSAALSAAQQLSQSNPALYPLVAAALVDLLKAAVDEARTVPADLEQLAEEWAAAPASAHATVHHALQQQRAGGPSHLTSLASQCRSLCSRRWGVWEGHLLDIGTDSLQQRIATIQGNIAALRAQRDRLLEQERDMNDADRLRQRRAEVESMQAQVRSARAALEASKQQLSAVSDETSQLLETHQSRLVRLAGGEDRAALHSAEAAALQRMKEQDDALHAARRGVDDVRLILGVVNRLSYCRTTCYKSSEIEVEAVLSAFLRVSIRFQLACSGGEAGELVVSGVHVELEKSERVAGAAGSAEDRERDLAEAFFRSVLCCAEIDGPLSPRVLERVERPRDIPGALQRISGFISALRRVSTWLHAFEADGWTTQVQPETSTIVATSPTRAHALHLPLCTVVSGDIGALPVTCLRDQQGTACLEGPMRGALQALKARHASPFGSFPSGPLRQAVEAVLRQV